MNNEKINQDDYVVLNGIKIGFGDVINEIRETTGTTPLSEGEYYYKMDASIAKDDISSYGATFFVKATSESEAIERARSFLLSSREMDDTGFEIGWTTLKLYYKPESYEPEIEVIGEPLDESMLLNQKRQSWHNYVSSSNNYNNGGKSGLAEQSKLAMWKWPIIFIPLILAVIIFLEYLYDK